MACAPASDFTTIAPEVTILYLLSEINEGCASGFIYFGVLFFYFYAHIPSCPLVEDIRNANATSFHDARPSESSTRRVAGDCQISSSCRMRTQGTNFVALRNLLLYCIPGQSYFRKCRYMLGYKKRVSRTYTHRGLNL